MCPIDLHIHSSFSDGIYSPTELVVCAKSEGLSTIAIADHDSVVGIAEGIAAGACHGILILPAVELSVQFGPWKDVHLLGYGIDFRDYGFLKRLNDFRERRKSRNYEILDRVNNRLIFEKRAPIPVEDVLAYAKDAIGRPHIARALIERGYADSIDAAFNRYLIPCNTPKLYWPIQDAIHTIKDVGGVPVLAHPTSITNDRHELRRIIGELAGMGLEGVEAFNNIAQPEEMAIISKLASEMDLLVTGGSDFHGIEENVKMGRGRGGIRFDESLLIPLKKRLAERQNQLLSL